MAGSGKAHGVGTGEHAHAWANALQEMLDDRGDQVVFRTDREPRPATRRLMASLGVRVEVGPMKAASAHALTASRDCAHPSCVDDASPHERFCSTHLQPKIVVSPPRTVAPAPEPETVEETWSRRKVTPDAAIEALQAYVAETGLMPNQGEWKASRRKPSVQTYCRLFGGWPSALSAAGITAEKSSGLAVEATPEPAEPTVAPEPTFDDTRFLPYETHGVDAATCPVPVTWPPVEVEEPEEREIASVAPSIEVAKPEATEREIELSIDLPALHVAKNKDPAERGPGQLSAGGGFTPEMASNARAEAAKLRQRADALEAIAAGIELLGEVSA